MARPWGASEGSDLGRSTGRPGRPAWRRRREELPLGLPERDREAARRARQHQRETTVAVRPGRAERLDHAALGPDDADDEPLVDRARHRLRVDVDLSSAPPGVAGS